MTGLIGRNPEQVPTNSMLGSAGFMNVEDLPAAGMAVVNSIADLRNVSSAQYSSAYVLYAYTPGDFGQGVFRVAAPLAVATDDGGINITAVDGAGWTREWDGTNVWASWYGLTPSTPDAGAYFSKFPKYAVIWFQPGSYTFLTYPTEADFQSKFYRGISTIWRCNTAFADTTVASAAFTWSFVASVTGTDATGNNMADMQQAGLSPIEGIGIIGNSVTKGVGLQIGSGGTQVYYIRPRWFSVGGFGIGFQFAPTIRNCFLTGAEQVTLKGNGTNLIVDNTDYTNTSNPGAPNSGENFLFRSCYFGNASVVGALVTKAQLCTFDNCSFDYNVKMGSFVHSNVKMKNCYVEGNPANMKTWFDVLGVSCLDVDSSTNIYMLGGTVDQMNYYDVFYLAQQDSFGNPNVRCNASFNSSQPRLKPLSSSSARSAFGSLMRCNGGVDVPIVGEACNAFFDARISSTDMSLYPGSSNTTVGSVAGTPAPDSGATNAIRMLAGSTTVGATWVMPKQRVQAGKELYIQFLEMIDQLSVTTKRIAVRFYTADGVLIPQTTFTKGSWDQIVPALTATSSWTRRRYAPQVPMGADYCTISFSVDPKAASADGGSWFVNTVYTYQ